MSIKGRATIQLFDENKNLVHESVEDNLITDAVKRIVMLEERGFFKGHRKNMNNNMYAHLTQITPFVKHLLGGILLFGNTIDEDESIVFPPIGSTPVGHAGGSYAGANIYRGSYNPTESGTLYSGTSEIGYRHVWDFATDKANGLISCICLTSTVGGNTGWISRGMSNHGGDTNVYDADSCIDAVMCSGGNLSLSSRPFSTPNSQAGIPVLSNLFSQTLQYRIIYVDEITGTIYIALPHSSTYPGVIAKVVHSPSLSLNLLTDVDNGAMPSLENHIVTNKSYSEFNFNGFFEVERDTGNVTMTFATSATTLVSEKWSPATGLISRETVSIAGSGSTIINYSSPYLPPFYYHGHFYACVSTSGATRILKISSSGEIVASFDWSAMLNTQWRAVYSAELDRIVIRSASTSNIGSKHGVAVIFDGETLIPFRTFEASGDTNGEVPCSNPVAPGTYMALTSGYNGAQKELYYKFFTNYLGSINNLATPVTKTAATTMKITYDIYTE